MQIKACKTPDEGIKKNEHKAGTASICIFANPLKSQLCADTCSGKTISGCLENLTSLILYDISLVGPQYILLIWQYFLSGDIFMAAPWAFSGIECKGGGEAKEMENTPGCYYGDSSLCNVKLHCIMLLLGLVLILKMVKCDHRGQYNMNITC